MLNHFDNSRLHYKAGVLLTIKDQGLTPLPKDERLAQEADPEYGVSKDCDT